MGNNLCSDVDPLPAYREPAVRGTSLMQQSQWFTSQSKTEDTGIPIVTEPLRRRLEELGT